MQKQIKNDCQNKASDEDSDLLEDIVSTGFSRNLKFSGHREVQAIVANDWRRNPTLSMTMARKKFLGADFPHKEEHGVLLATMEATKCHSEHK